jgi:hypothetical protein
MLNMEEELIQAMARRERLSPVGYEMEVKALELVKLEQHW